MFSITNGNSGKYCSAAFIRMVKIQDFVHRLGVAGPERGGKWGNESPPFFLAPPTRAITDLKSENYQVKTQSYPANKLMSFVPFVRKVPHFLNILYVAQN